MRRLPQWRADMDIGHVRHDFTDHAPLEAADMAADPFMQFERWFRFALDSGIAEPNAFSLATVGTDGMPSQRAVLLKFFDEKGFVFYTNYNSRKAQEMADNAQVAMLFPFCPATADQDSGARGEGVARADAQVFFEPSARFAAWRVDIAAKPGDRFACFAAQSVGEDEGEVRARRSAAAGFLGGLPHCSDFVRVLAGATQPFARPFRVPHGWRGMADDTARTIKR